MVWKKRMVHFGYFRMSGQILDNFQSIGNVTFHTERQGFQTLQQDKSIERRDRGSCITQNNSPDASDESCRPRHIGKDRPMITWVRFAQGRELIGICFPIEIATVHNHSSQARSVSTDKFGGGMDDDIGAVFDRADQVRCTECIIHDQRDIMTVGHLRHSIDIGNIRIRIAERFDIHYFRILPDGSLQRLRVVYIYNRMSNTLSR